MYALGVPSLQMFQTAMLFATLARNELFHANTKSWRNLFTSSPATLFTWLHTLVFISPSLSFFSRSLLLAAQRPVFLILTTVPLLTILVHLYPYSTVLLEARNVNHNNQLFHPLGKLVPSRSDMTVGRARVLPWLPCIYWIPAVECGMLKLSLHSLATQQSCSQKIRMARLYPVEVACYVLLQKPLPSCASVKRGKTPTLDVSIVASRVVEWSGVEYYDNSSSSTLQCI